MQGQISYVVSHNLALGESSAYVSTAKLRSAKSISFTLSRLEMEESAYGFFQESDEEASGIPVLCH